MKKRYIHIIAAAILLLFQGCTQTELEEQEIKGDEILLSSQAEETSSAVRAVGNFPNDGTIGLFATTQYDSNEAASANWREYSDINNAKATVSSVNNGVYAFTWEEKKYWPFDGSDLYFAAYSPYATGNDNNYILSEDGTSLFMVVHQNMYDILYASNNLTPQAYNKNNSTVNLGEFMHLLSQLTVEVIAQNNMSPTIRLSELTISTKATSGTFNLLEGENSLNVDVLQGNPQRIPFVSGQVDFRNPKASYTQLLFPETESYTEISIGLIDTSNNFTFNRSYMMSYFQNDNGLREPITLQRGKNTLLRIQVNGIGVDDPDLNISLSGIITDWNDQGRYGVTIE